MKQSNLPPAHPGEILREEFLKARNLTISAAAKGLKMTRANLSAICNEHSGISPALAVKLSQAFGNTAKFWINLQTNYELWHAERNINRSEISHLGDGLQGI